MGATGTRVDRGIYKLEDGSYRVAVAAGKDPITGKYRQVFRRYRGTLTGARDLRRKLLAEVESGQHTAGSRTLDELFDAWLKAVERRRAPKTVKGYRSDAKVYWRDRLGSKRLSRITRADIKAVLLDLEDRGLSPSTVDHAHACISAAWSWGMKNDWVVRDVTKHVELPDIIRRRPPVPTPAQVGAMLRAAGVSERPEMQRFGWLGAITGARMGELRAIRRTMLHLEDGRLAVDVALSAEVEWVPKNKRWRDVGLDELTIAVLEDQIDFMAKRASDGGVELADDAYLFSDDQAGRKPWREDMVTHFWSKLCDDVGLGQFTFKHLRKFMDTYGQELGFTVDDVAERAGHTPEVARRHYTGARRATDQRLATALGALLAAESDRVIDVEG